MVDVEKSRIKAFRNAYGLSKWLEQHHDSETELWVKIYKKNSGVNSINWNETVIESLRWGWIDGVKKSLDDVAYLQRITPRKKGSNWSKRNTERVNRLIQEGRMEKPGMMHVKAAKSDGRWNSAYAPQCEMEVPPDFLAALDQNKKAKKFFASLNKTNLYSITYRLSTAKKPEIRQKRFDKIMKMLEKNEKFH